MFGDLVKQLNSKVILSNKNIMDLKWYISSRYADLSAKDAAKIFADAVNKIIDKHIPYFEESIKNKIKTTLFENAIKKPEFEITGSDVLRVCLLTKSHDETFYDIFYDWISKNSFSSIPQSEFSYSLNKIRTLTEQYPYKNIDEIIEQSEKKQPIVQSEKKQPIVNEIKPQKHTESNLESIFNSRKLDLVNDNNINNPSSPYSNPYKGSNNVNDYPLSTNFNLPENNYSNQNINQTQIQSYNSYSVSVGDYQNRPANNSVEFTYVNSNEYKPIYSFNNTDNYVQKIKDDGVKSKFTTFIKKVTMKKFLSVSIAVSAGLIIAKSQIGSTPIDSNIKPNSIKQEISTNDVSILNEKSFSIKSANAALSSNLDIPLSEKLIPQETLLTIEAPKVEVKSDIQDFTANSYKKMAMRATAYDLSVESCGKSRTHPQYGMTATGVRAQVNHTIAVDPNVIPLKSKVYVVFPENYSHLNGVYFAEDTGGAIKGNKIDVYLGEDLPGSSKISKIVDAFGIQQVTVYLLNSNSI